MRKIHTLPEHIISQIAAGEVIERPVYAVKELVENSVDAGADSITITIEQSGLKKIVVTDNGEGMSKEDLVESFKPHTTSKLLDDLIGIKTLGFRGEALSSIAAVSDLLIQSRLQNASAGTQISLRSGKIEKIGPVGMPPGTSVSVSNLFYSVPARKKFLKSERTEFRHIVELVTQYAISYPEIRFLLIHNGRIIIDLPKNQKRKERIETLLGMALSSNLLSIISESSYITIEGFIARPELSTRSQTKQFLFVNSRAVTDRLIMTAAREAYGNLLESTSYPIVVLFLTIPHEAVDVNVHPRKEHVAFVNKNIVFDAVKEAVERTLAENNLTFYNMSFSPRAGTITSAAAESLRSSLTPWSPKDLSKMLKNSGFIQLHNLYLFIQTKNGMLFIDQHAAHERILYEQFSNKFKVQNSKLKMYKLPKSVLLELSASEIEVLEEYEKSLEKFGIKFEIVGLRSMKINSVPEPFRDQNIERLISEILAQLSEDKKITIDYFFQTMIKFLACRAAIKAGEAITSKEAKRLLEKLEKTPHNATCPHGRPTKIEVSLAELNRMFKR